MTATHQAGVLPCDLESRGESDNSSANDRDINLLHLLSVFSRDVKNQSWPFDRTNHSNRSPDVFQPLRSAGC